jgi:hypothetical protein
MPVRKRTWCFTWNNYTSQNLDFVEGVLKDTSVTRFGCYGLEVAPTTGTPHIQGYIRLVQPKSFNALVTWWGQGPHFEIAKGNEESQRKYCSKTRPEDEAPNEVYKEFGTPKRPGKRNDLLAVKDAIRNGANMREIADEYFSEWVKYRSAFKDYATMINVRTAEPRYALDSFPSEWRTIVPRDDKSLIIWGPAGCGKTEFVVALMPKALFVSHVDDLLNFDPSVHDGIIFDDIDFKHFPRTSQIHLVDTSHPRSIHCRYNTATIPAKTKKIFTTNEENGNIFLIEDAAIKRRVSIHHVGFFQ